MEKRNRKGIQVLRNSLWLMFCLYILIILRITLFKDTALNNLSAAFGASERRISVIPFYSVFEMIDSHVSLQRILENILGNVALFVPAGIVLAALKYRKGASVILYGVGISAVIELLQLIFGLGATDIDDLMFNSLGVCIGHYIVILTGKKVKSRFAVLAVMNALLLIGGSAGGIFLFVNYTELFLWADVERTAENVQIVSGFIDTPPYLTGKLVVYEEPDLMVEKSVKNAAELRANVLIRITQDTKFYLCESTSTFFHSALVSEYEQYMELSPMEFTQFCGDVSNLRANVIVWSEDGETVNNIVVIKNR